MPINQLNFFVVYWLTSIFLAVYWLQLYPIDTLTNVDMEIFESRKKKTVD